MIIYHDPNSIIREAYEKVLIGGKYILEAASTKKDLILQKLDEEPDYIPRAYNYILKSIPDNQIATIYQHVFGQPMRGRASSNKGKISDKLGNNTNGINFLLKYVQPNIIDYLGGMVGIDPRAKNSSQQAQDGNTSQNSANNALVDEIIGKLKNLKLNNESLRTIYRKIFSSVSDKNSLFTAARNLYNKTDNYYDIGAVLVKAMQEQRGTFVLGDFANILRYLNSEDLAKVNSIVDEYVSQKKNGVQQNQVQSQTQSKQQIPQTQKTVTQSNTVDNIDISNIQVTDDMILAASNQLGIKCSKPMQKIIKRIFSRAKKSSYQDASNYFVRTITEHGYGGIANNIKKIADYIVTNKDKLLSNPSSNTNVDNTPYIVDIIDISSKGELPRIARAVGVSDDPDTIEKCDLELGALFDKVAKVGYPAARKSFMEEYWMKEGDDVIKMADYINQNKSKFMDTKQSYQKRQTALKNLYKQNMEGARQVQAYQNSLNTPPKNNVNGMRTTTNNTHKNNAPTNNVQPNQNKNRTVPTKQQSSKYDSGIFNGQTTFIVDDDV